MTEKTITNKPELIPVSKFNNYYKYPTVGALRQLMFYNTDGFNDCVTRRIGKRIYINVPEFFKWVEKTGKKHEEVV